MSSVHEERKDGADLGRRMFHEADEEWQRHLAATPEDVADVLQYFERLRSKAEGIDAEADGMGITRIGHGVVFRRTAKEAFRMAAETAVKAMISEWKELADRDHDVFDQVNEKFVPAASYALIFPNDPPASRWDDRMYALLHENFRTLAYHMGLDVPDRPPPVRNLHADQPPSHGNRHTRRAWKKQNRKAAA